MARLSQHVSTMWSSIKCPNCGTLVDPNTLTYEDPSPPPGDESAPTTGADGQRWSFIWRPPRGDFCPNCDFPLSKYFGRIKWIRTFMVGVAIVLLAVMLQIVGNFARLGEAYYLITRNAIRVGAVVAIVGALGIIIGGKRGRVRATDRM